MEDSAKRRERLQAMRMEASSSAEGPSASFSTTNTPLSNPLIHPFIPVSENSPSSHRFDYYTDPTAAYSPVKRKTNGSGAGRGYFETPNPSSSSYTIKRKADDSSAGSGYFKTPNSSSPASATRPAQQIGQNEQHMFPNYFSHQPFSSPNQNLYNTPSFFGSQGDLYRRSSVQNSSPAAESPVTHNFSRRCIMSGSSSGSSYYTNSSKGDLSYSRHGESPMSSAYSGPMGRGESPIQFQGGGRGRGGGYHNKSHGLGNQQLDSFYVKSMATDPWCNLKPIIGNILVPLSRPGPPTSKSIQMKEAKISETVFDIKPRQNLAEILALAFDETISDVQEGEGIEIQKLNDGDESNCYHSDGAE